MVHRENHLEKAKIALGVFTSSFCLASIGYMVVASQSMTPYLRLIGSPYANNETLSNPVGAGLLMVIGIVLGTFEGGRQMLKSLRDGNLR